ncbi:UNVERIFIED_CONTAM: hypothetical protein FKN15_068388 [Acipenser sinensis]
MSGGIFSPLDNLYNLDNANCHPLVCYLCHEQYEQPCLLDCYHTFCASCLRGRALDSRLTCPLCSHAQQQHSNTEPCTATAQQHRAMHSNSTATQSHAQQQHSNTEPCTATAQQHRAMHSYSTETQSHAPLQHSNTEPCTATKSPAQLQHSHTEPCTATQSPLHEELYIMFSTEKKSMLCINCFRDTQVESRAHCIDIETAYMQGCEKLDQAVLVRVALVFNSSSVETERGMVLDSSSVCNDAPAFKTETRIAIISDCLFRCNQHEEKERAFKEQLSHLAALLPTLQVHLVSCSAFLSSANKFEFLDLGYQLMERLKKIVKLPHRLRPTQSCKINTEYRSEFARCLEPLLLLSHRRSVSLTGGGGGASGISNASALLQSPLSLTVPSSSDMSLSAAVVHKPTAHRYISTKVLLAEGDETPFTEHCRSYENKYRTLQAEIQKLKDQVQEMHRDLTKHHSLVNTDTIGDVLHKSLQMDGQIASEYASVEMMRAMFEEIWEETFQRVANEQEIYEAQLHDLVQLRQENTYLTTITKQISPYIRSIAKVKERLEPRLKESKELKDDRTETMLHIYDDSAACSEAQHRNDLTCGADESRDKTAENREKIIDNCSLNILSEESALKTKDYYRSGKQKNSGDPPGRKELPV